MRFLWIVGIIQIIFAAEVISIKQVLCNNPTVSQWSSTNTSLKTCRPNVILVGEEKFAIGSPDSSIEGISISDQKNIKFFPQNLATFPDLIGVNIYNCSVETIDYNDFKNLWKLRALHVEINEIAFVSSEAFKDLVSLESLYLTFNKIKFLDAEVFESQRNLKILKLGKNQINFLHPKIFQPLVKIDEIYLNDNKLLTISENIFENLANLKNVSLHMNNLVEVPEKLFASNLKLEFIWFNPNKIKFVKPEAFANLTNLKYVDFSGNECTNKYYWANAFDDMRKELKDNCSSDQTKLEEKNKNLEMQIAVLANAHSILVQEMQKLRLEMEFLKNDIQAVNKTAHGVAFIF